MPLLFRQSLRSSIHITRTTSRPVRAPFRPTTLSASPVRPSRTFSVCLQCQFRRQPYTYLPDDKDKASNDAERLIKAVREAPEAIVIPEVDAGAARAGDTTETDGVNRESQPDASEKAPLDQEEQARREEQSANAEGARRGGLPSYLESRRSQMSKQFSTMMDNLQSNVFVAGQRLNDLTGYSGIEALKKDIHIQGTSVLLVHPDLILIFDLPRGPTPHSSRTRTTSQGRIHSRDQSPLDVTARSERTPAAQARLVSNRPGAVHAALPQRPYQ